MKRSLTRIAHCLLAAGVCLGAAPGVAQSELPRTLIDLPQIGEPADRSISPMEERRLGAQIVAQLYGFDYVLEDPEISEYISALGWKLAAASNTKPQELEFFLINDARINAFALPGGYIGINAGLLLAASTESEVAGVMGHELAHVTQRHIARTVEGSQAANLATWAAVLAAILIGSADPDVVIGALSLGQAINYQRQVNYTRAHELEADRIGIQTMARAGFAPEGMVSFFTKLEQQSRLYGSGLPEFLRTHPLNTTRISEARARAAEMPAPLRRVEPVDFELMRARARVLLAERPSEPLNYFTGLLGAGQDSPGNRYGQALALARLGQSEQALGVLAPVLEAYPRQANLLLLKGQIELFARNHDAALATFSRALELYPRYAPAIFAKADALITVGRPEAAREVLIGHEQALGTRLQTYNLLAQAARDSGNMPEASFQMANFLFLRGNSGGAIGQLDAGLRLDNLSPAERARLSAKREEVRATLPPNWRPPEYRTRAALQGSD
jgi:beta-barrel assembly-enhancing protease